MTDPVIAPAAAQPAPAPTAPVVATPASPAAPAAPAAEPAPQLFGKAAIQQDFLKGIERLRAEAKARQNPAPVAAPVVPVADTRPRGADGKFLPAAKVEAPATDPGNPPVGQPDAEPLIEVGGKFGKVPQSKVPSFVEGIVNQRTVEITQFARQKEAEAANAARDAAALKPKVAELEGQLDEMIEWAGRNPQAMINFLQQPEIQAGVAARRGHAPQMGGPQLGPPQPQAPATAADKPMTRSEMEAFWNEKQAEVKRVADQQAFDAAEDARVETALTSTLTPIIGRLPQPIQKMIRREIGTSLNKDAVTLSVLTPDQLHQRIATEAAALRDALYDFRTETAAAQLEIVNGAHPAVVGGSNLVPQNIRAPHHPLDRKALQAEIMEARARLRNGM